jgi:hypothetical protein
MTGYQMMQGLRLQCKALQAERDALRRELDRWQRDELIESDLIRSDGSIAWDPYAECDKLCKELKVVTKERDKFFSELVQLLAEKGERLKGGEQ